MSPYRKQVEKLYNRIIKVVGKGESYIRRYYDIIDEVIEYGKSDILQDALLKFKIDTTTFNTIDDLKKNTFKKIAFYINSTISKQLESLFLSKNVYRVGNHFYDTSTSKYLGDIEQSEDDNSETILNVYVYIPKFLTGAIPQFPLSTQNSIYYATQSLIYYGNNIYECSNDYTWSNSNQITPTYSAYWDQIIVGTPSLQQITSSTSSLVEKYSTSIDILKTYTFIYTYTNDFIAGDYVEDYME